jgi:predicted nucleotidyltransferase
VIRRAILLSEEQKRKASRLLEGFDATASAYLFGSTSVGCARSGSDIDIAVRVRNGVPSEERFEIRMALVSDLEPLFDAPVDVLVMNDASLAILYQVFSNGDPLFIRDPEEEEQFRVNRLKAFFDFRYYLDRDFDETERFFGKASRG